MSRDLFLDANVFLSFYLFGKDDLSELEKLEKLVKDEEVVLYSNDLLRQEIERNREKKISEGFENFRKMKFGGEFPAYCSTYTTEFSNLRADLKKVGETHRALVDLVSKDITSKSLAADKIIERIIRVSKIIKITPDVINKARLRCDLGNPPGKRGSIGDAVHWECILATPGLNELDIVSLDGDFASAISLNKIDPFLADEWEVSSFVSTVNLFTSLNDYFKARYPSVSLSTEAEKDSLVDQLQVSGNFSETHRIIERLATFGFFTRRQAVGLFDALLSNNQVNWIASDPDVNDFYKKIVVSVWEWSEETLIAVAAALGEDETFYYPWKKKA